MSDIALVAMVAAVYLFGFALTVFLSAFFAWETDDQKPIGYGLIWPFTWAACAVMFLAWVCIKFIGAFELFAKAGFAARERLGKESNR